MAINFTDMTGLSPLWSTVFRRLKADTAGRRLRQSQLDQYNASALYGVGVVDKTSHHDVSYSVAGSVAAAGDSAGIRNNEYARMRLQRLAAGQPYRDGGVPPYGAPYRGGGGAHLQQLMHGVVEHIYESPDVVRRDAFHDEQYTPTNAAAGPGQQQHQQQHHQHHHQQQQQLAQSPHHGYWPLPSATPHPEPTSPSTRCCVGSTPPKNGLKAKSTGNYSL